MVEKENKKDIDKMLSETTANFEENSNHKRNGKKIIVIALASTLVVSLFAFGMFKLMPSFGTNITGKEKGIQEGEIKESSYGDIATPIEVDSWVVVPYIAQNKESETFIKNATVWGSQTMLGNYTGMFPSKAGGYTSDPSKATLDNGQINPDYSFILKDDIEYAFANYTQRLLNPIFGGWSLWQHKDSNVNKFFNGNGFEDMFTKEWWEANIVNGQIRNLPIYADWNLDDYGGLVFDEDSYSRFFGEIENLSADFNIDGESVTFKINMDIKFTSFGPEEKIIKNGKMYLELVSNNENPENTSQKMLINNAKLTVN